MIKKRVVGVEDILSQFRLYFQKRGFSSRKADDHFLLHSEIFTVEQMEAHARQLAQSHQLNFDKKSEHLIGRLSQSEDVITNVIALMQDAVRDNKRIYPAGEWLLDNFYLIKEQIDTGKKYLPKGYSKGLPKLVNNNVVGLPRVYDVALEIISHSDGHITTENLQSFINAYQQHSKLTIGELWAVPIMLRIALLENLSLVSAQIGIDQLDENIANRWADKLLKAAEKDPKNLILIVADMVRSGPPLVPGFVVPFAQRLQWNGSEMSVVISWVESQLAEKNTSINAMMRAENRKQAANQISVSNSINSLRFLAKKDWRDFVEAMSVTENILRDDPAGVFAKMDFNTRDLYRHAIEKASKRHGIKEEKIASMAVSLASNAEGDENDRKKHVGFYLIGKGQRLLEDEIRRNSRSVFISRKGKINFHRLAYAFTAVTLTIVPTALLLFKIYLAGFTSYWPLAIMAIVLLVCTSQFALQIANWLGTLIVKPQALPRMDFSRGIPADSTTMVVVPSMLSDEHQVTDLIEELEIRFLANKGPRLYFALLTDFVDANQEQMPADNELLSLAEKGIGDLNAKYDTEGAGRFYLFHRKRTWNKYQKKWMGWERKRGKLEDLNNLLRGRAPGRFIRIIGNRAVFSSIKYVITLDTDTQLPRDAAWKLTGIMAHPLNKPVIDAHKNIVVDGYGIVQPRIAISLRSTERSRYTIMHENDAGIDPYTRVTSDLYQDVFREGSYIGKGIYDLDVFEKVLGGRFPDNKILSHDLLEGSYVRSAYASDTQLYEIYPAKYMTDMNRHHRWIRGDWQIASWLLPWVRNYENKWVRNPINGLAKWKIFDNLRRSLVPVALTVLLISGWTWLGLPLFWTIVVITICLLPPVIGSIWNIAHKPADIRMTHHLRNTATSVYRNISEAVFYLIRLPYEGYISLDAILRSVWRMVITRRNLLNWNPYSADRNKNYRSLSQVYRSMWPAVFIALTTTVFITIGHGASFFWAAPFLIAWFLLPAVVWWLGFPLKEKGGVLSAKQIGQLRKLARKTWLFYETFVGPEDNWLPPDNFQQQPITVLAHRTSPTNMGLTLLANLSAWDFGYISLDTLEERCRNTLDTMQKLDRYSGHFYNWYDTLTMQPLHPYYVSTVDSGNLGAHLLVLKQGLLNLPDEPLIGNKNVSGIIDVLFILSEEVAGDHEKASIQKSIVHLEGFMEQQQDNIYVFKKLLDDLVVLHTPSSGDETEATFKWRLILKKQIEDLQNSLLYFIPWIGENSEDATLQTIPSLNALARSKGEAIHYPDMETAESRARKMILQLQALASLCEDLADMEYDFLYDESQHLLTIGYNAEEHKRDNSYYDLLASEARLGSFLAIAQNKIPSENWFALGRRLTSTGGHSVLLSWSGSMFEYLMPRLVMPAYENTLLDHSNKGAVQKQIDYGHRMGTPWGISESCYNVVDAHLNYQYRAFGVPGLGLKRGLGEDLVIAPYASVMALMIQPVPAYQNIERMISRGYEGRYGFFESVDFTASRLPRNHSSVIIQTFMVHHLGMSFLSLAYALLDKPMQKRFISEPIFKATLLLLQEQIPRLANFYNGVADSSEVTVKSAASEMRVIKTPHTLIPKIQLLSNGRYHVMVTNSGGGYSRWKDRMVTRWREDSTCDNWGSFCYIRDVESGEFWSNTYHPTLIKAKTYEAIFSQGRAEYKRLDNGIETHTDVIVSPEDDVEIRRITLTNRSGKRRKIEITSYAEVVLNYAGDDNSHPAFSNLFIQTEIVDPFNAIICTRRPRSDDENHPWMYHLIKTKSDKKRTVSYETDRNRFIGRGNTPMNPVAERVETLSNTQGSVLDPIVAIRYRFELAADETFSFDILTGVAETKDNCEYQISKYQEKVMRDRAFELSWTHTQVILRQINATESDAYLFGKMAGSVVYPNPYQRAASSVLAKNQRGQSSLWGFSISGDLPIVLLQISSQENMSLVKQMIQARAYWQLKGLSVDLFIWNEDDSNYRQGLQDQIQQIITNSASFNDNKQQGGVYVRPVDQISEEDKILLQTVARVIISDRKGTLANQLNRKLPPFNKTPYLLPASFRQKYDETNTISPAVQFDNGLGGFSAEGHEYIIRTGREIPPAPWVNVIANKQMGCVLSESGSTYTWFENAHEYRLTPWSNDPVSDGSGECFFIRDEKSGHFWSPSPAPAKGRNDYITKHGYGYSVFEYNESGIESDMEIFVDTDDAVKFYIINLYNKSGFDRELSLTGYVEWVLGDIRSKTGMHIVTEIDLETGAIYAGNPYNKEFEGRVGFFYSNEIPKSYTASRTEFIGRNGHLSSPDALKRERLSGKTGAGFDSCAALQYVFRLSDGQRKQIIFKLGAAKSMVEAKALVKKHRSLDAALHALDRVHLQWETLLHKVTVETPDKGFDLLLNGWTLYQTISCRIWGRSGFYQSGGAFGFRDQLQDAMAVLYAHPALARELLLLSAARQFKEGDVQHWWHPPQGKGVRTHCSDDYLWLPFVAARYIRVTGETALLDEEIPFLEGRLLRDDEESYYDQPGISSEKATFYEHCKRAIRHGFRYGVHGLPLIGGGDWNDGMNRVGKEGKGESVWLAFFLYNVLQNFKEVAALKNDPDFVKECDDQSAFLKEKIHQNAWDGQWHIRAFFDDGTPLGSSKNEEGRIDSISQSWSVLSGAGDPQRIKPAMAALEKYLVDRDAGLIKLLTPAFDKSSIDPGYIKGYVPGVRENGGQYTHAAVWAIMAFAKMGDKKLAWELLQMISPLNHGDSADKISTYKVEPYVMAADVYSGASHVGRGGWTWYTGSSGWYYRLMLETFIGLQVRADEITFEPLVPDDWRELRINYRYKTSVYHILLQRGDVTKNTPIRLADDGQEHSLTYYFE